MELHCFGSLKREIFLFSSQGNSQTRKKSSTTERVKTLRSQSPYASLPRLEHAIALVSFDCATWIHAWLMKEAPLLYGWMFEDINVGPMNRLRRLL